MKVVFVDESGTPAPGSDERYLVVAALVADSTRPITPQMKRIRQSLGLNPAKTN
jgi:hypothetical protein